MIDMIQILIKNDSIIMERRALLGMKKKKSFRSEKRAFLSYDQPILIC